MLLLLGDNWPQFFSPSIEQKLKVKYSQTIAIEKKMHSIFVQVTNRIRLDLSSVIVSKTVSSFLVSKVGKN